ncbi:hypothetical protein CTEN210_00291 [Chaetoceros tenuissimus]|uniref:Leucine-rich repeat domain-containing protein n=1 Tax=Chaetoceros tenuissimus TaxID=426638 RepID=A0AAD3GYU1_9STRA|nr:hypothetical protein CTEN210_00291 [Chaetoceros tenuissimus]
MIWNPQMFLMNRVIFADTVVGIRQSAFKRCKNLEYIKLSLGLEFIGEQAFSECKLSSVFIPPRCRYIGDWSFVGNANLTILNVPRNTQLRIQVFHSTELYERSPFGGNDGSSLLDRVNTWLKNVNNDDQFALHRLCSSFEPTLDMILDTMKDKGGPKAFKEENIIGISPSDYLKENPFANVKEMDIIKGYVHKMMGEL